MTAAGGAINKHKRSLVWIHFEQRSDDNGICDICGDKVVTSGNTTNLFKVYSLHESLK